MGLDDILKWIEDHNMHKGVLVIIFTFGNISLGIILSVFCYFLKPIKVLYNTLGAISTGTLMAAFVNLLLLGILLGIDLTTEVILYSGIFISIACYAFCLHYADRLWKIGKIHDRK
ncbi:hypothetical protein ATE84_1438 [Aquimarina sp. MAR_2010_214]|uniref:hypothetical protein n=1 Tax=Aquimarina sp. MAR_2010_214 TaxID=1250026 RepID=UPI000C702D33|nr:hypothetical protein [Aquimarina sp. MAR_2010_214]PKV49415.1 hypothetical protein ATE84_1438 [Aquimarina sp. MAR_2010_214]